MKRIILFFFLFSGIISQYSIVSASVRYVSKTGSSTPPYTTWATAADSIQKCINISSFGDTIYVGEGIYQEFVRMSEGLSLIGTGYDNCTIDGRTFIASTTDELIIMKDSCLISGFKIIVSNFNPAISSYDGHAISAYTDSVSGNYTTIVKNNLITQAYFGTRTNIIDANVINNVFTNCRVAIIFSSYFLPMKFFVLSNIIHATSTGVSSGLGSISTINNNIIYLESSSAVASRSFGELDYYNNLIIATVNSSRGVANSSYTTNIINNTFIGYIVIPILAHDNTVIKNNILFTGGIGINNDALNTTIKNNCLWDFNEISRPYLLDSTNLIADPMFVDTSNENYYLQMFSPCIDSGDPSILDVDGSRSDMGVFGGPYGESYTYQDLAPRPPVNVQGEIFDGDMVKIYWKQNSEADLHQYKVYKDTTANFIISPFNLISTIIDTFFIEKYDTLTNIYYKVTAVDTTGHESMPGEEVALLVTGVQEVEVIEKEFQLYQNYPNPFNPSTNISFYLNERDHVKLIVYDSKGEKISELINREMTEGYHEIKFPTEERIESKQIELAAGVYVYSLSLMGRDKKIRHTAKKMMLLK